MFSPTSGPPQGENGRARLHVASINTQRGRTIVATPLLSLKRKFKLFV